MDTFFPGVDNPFVEAVCAEVRKDLTYQAVSSELPGLERPVSECWSVHVTPSILQEIALAPVGPAQSGTRITVEARESAIVVATTE